MVAIKHLQKQLSSLDQFTEAVNRSSLRIQGKSLKVHLEIEGKTYEVTRNQLVKLAISLVHADSATTLWLRVRHLKNLEEKLIKLQKAEAILVKSSTRGYGIHPEDVPTLRRRQTLGNLFFNRERALHREIHSLTTKLDRQIAHLEKFSRKIALSHLKKYKAAFPSSPGIDKKTKEALIKDLRIFLKRQIAANGLSDDYLKGIAILEYDKLINKIWPKVK